MQICRLNKLTKCTDTATASATTSGAGTNLKVGCTDPAQNAGKKFFWSCPSTFWL